MFRFAGERLSSFSNREPQRVRLGDMSLEEREWEREDDETLRELEKNEQSIRSAISRLKARKTRTKRF